MRMMTPRPFCLMVDAASREEPPTRYFATFDAARTAAGQYDQRWQPFVWITELTDKGVVVHMKDGKEQDPFDALWGRSKYAAPKQDGESALPRGGR